LDGVAVAMDERREAGLPSAISLGPPFGVGSERRSARKRIDLSVINGVKVPIRFTALAQRSSTRQ
jgi:hypothetical protein